ncbi:hypothetical protein HPB48_023092 [Haemaphysalis longicornis]|uniref:Uncharacterized protein n=1 Tax=Haemaphysalis longicornis TaxID=44386 RepID=A0A9J6GK46_HAELO|nr:hypothetical protein HPB48_023092 [Haemaphysalis longicornis]
MSELLSRSTNRRLRIRNYRVVGRCNREASFFNRLLPNYCRRSRTLFYLDHDLQFLPAARVLAADGLHPSFEFVALMASLLHDMCQSRRGPSITWSSTWLAKSAPVEPSLQTSTSPPRRYAASAAAPAVPSTAASSSRQYNLRSNTSKFLPRGRQD